MDVTGIFDADSLTLGELILAGVVLVVAGFLARTLRRRLRRYLESQEGLDSYLPPLVGRVAGWTVMLLGFVLALAILGFDMAPVVLIIFLIVAILALSGRGILENFAAGIVLQLRGPFRPGDRIEIADTDGTVTQINARAVVVETSDNRVVHVPNSDVLQNPIVNHSEREVRRSTVSVGIGYDENIDQARELAKTIMSGVPTVVDEPPPSVVVSELGDSAVLLDLRFWHTDEDRTRARSDVTERVKIAFDDAGIDMPFPQSAVTVQVDEVSKQQVGVDAPEEGRQQ